MSIIIIVSVAMFATINYSIKVNQESKIKSFFIGESENYITSYYLGEDKYDEAMLLLTGESYNYGEDATIYYDSKLIITSETSSPYKVVISFGEGRFSVLSYKGDSLIYRSEV